MNLICESKGIIDKIRPKARMRDMQSVGFTGSVYNAAVLCDPMEFQNIHRKNFKREEDVYLSEQPEKLLTEMERAILQPAKECGMQLPIAMAPYPAVDTKAEYAGPGVLQTLSEQTLLVAIAAGCERIVIHPLCLGIPQGKEGEVNKEFYRKLAETAERENSDICILLINKAKNINGHLVRGFCAEPEEMCAMVDDLNEAVGYKRFGCCFDIGTATLCGQNLYEAIVPLGERLEAVIVRDCDGVHDVAMLPYTACIKGQQTDWLYLVRALRKVDFDGDLILNLSDTYCGFLHHLRQAVLKLAYDVGTYLVWQIGMERMVKRYGQRVLFGAGNMCRAYMKDYGKEYPPLFTCDNNSGRWGEEFCGLRIEDPQKLKDLPEDVAILICNIYYDEIEEQLRKMGLKNPIERFSDEYMATFHMDRLKMAADPNAGKGAAV